MCLSPECGDVPNELPGLLQCRHNRDEYRHPHVAASAQGDYREGFRRGYQVAMDHMMDVNGAPHK